MEGASQSSARIELLVNERKRLSNILGTGKYIPSSDTYKEIETRVGLLSMQIFSAQASPDNVIELITHRNPNAPVQINAANETASASIRPARVVAKAMLPPTHAQTNAVKARVRNKRKHQATLSNRPVKSLTNTTVRRNREEAKLRDKEDNFLAEAKNYLDEWTSYYDLRDIAKEVADSVHHLLHPTEKDIRKAIYSTEDHRLDPCYPSAREWYATR